MDTENLETPQKTPSFQLVIEHLRAKIHSGELAAHAALPSERAIGEQFGLSRMTARRALVAIEMEGLAYSSNRRGRFVSPQRLTYDISKTLSLSARAEAGALNLEIDLISTEIVPATAQLAQKLSVAEGEELYKYVRLFRVQDHPAFMEEEYAVVRLFPGLFDHDLAQSTTKLMEQEYDMPSRSGDIVIRMSALNDTEAALLELPTYHSGIQLEQVIYSNKDQPICFGRQIWRGELAEFTAHAVVDRD